MCTFTVKAINLKDNDMIINEHGFDIVDELYHIHDGKVNVQINNNSGVIIMKYNDQVNIIRH